MHVAFDFQMRFQMQHQEQVKEKNKVDIIKIKVLYSVKELGYKLQLWRKYMKTKI
jgi:hypothetical protein